MGKNLSPMLRRELKNLDKDADTRKSALTAIRSYVEDMDPKAIHIFLAQVSNTKESGITSGEYTISLYEDFARVHGKKIIPEINNIMSTIVKTLRSGVTSFSLHQACSKVLLAIARYGIDPTTPDDEKRRIIHSLCKPLSDSLLSSHENLSSGAALCLKALVDSDNWRFASSEMVNEVCQRVVGALDKSMTVNSHVGLVMSLAKHDSLTVEAYARLLVRSGIKIMNMAASEGNSQKRLVAIQMINFLMKCLDYKCIMSELSFVIEEMKKCEDDQMAYVKGAAFEATETAKQILIEKGLKYEKQSCQRSVTASSETQTVNSLFPTSVVSQEVNSLNRMSKLDANGFPCDRGDNFMHDDDQFYDNSEPVCSTEDIFQQLINETKATSWFSVVTGFIVLFAMTVCFLFIGDANEDYNLVPT